MILEEHKKLLDLGWEIYFLERHYVSYRRRNQELVIMVTDKQYFMSTVDNPKYYDGEILFDDFKTTHEELKLVVGVLDKIGGKYGFEEYFDKMGE